MPEWSGFRKKKDGPQQGTLFDVREVPSQPVDSPGMRKRGRRAEMLAAMPETQVFGFRPDSLDPDELAATPGFSATQEKIVGRWGTDEWIKGEYQTERSLGAQQRAEMARRLADQTTVPPSDLEGLTGIRIGTRKRGSFVKNVAGRYVYESGGLVADIEAPREMDTGTLVHEIGHHVSIHREKNPPGVTASFLGFNIDPAEEARADAYALTHAEDDRNHTYASLARGIESEVDFTGPESPYRQERAARGQPLRDWEGGAPNVGQQFEQLASFEVEDAFAPEADAEVQALTRDEGREVLGWGPLPQKYEPQAIYKHEFDPNYEKPFFGANYVSMFNDDVVPERRRDDFLKAQHRWPPQPELKPRQVWKSK